MEEENRIPMSIKVLTASEDQRADEGPDPKLLEVNGKTPAVFRGTSISLAYFLPSMGTIVWSQVYSKT